MGPGYTYVEEPPTPPCATSIGILSPKISCNPVEIFLETLCAFLVSIVLTEFGIERNVKGFTLLCLLDSGLPFESDWSVRSEQSGMEGIRLSRMSTRWENVEAEKFPAISLVIQLAAGTCLFYQSILLPQKLSKLA